MRTRRRFAVAASAWMFLGAAASAQGTLSTQGLGYPPGQFSAAALGTAGATGETDPSSPLNPANLMRWVGSSSLHASYAPEFRRLSVGGLEANTTISRFPTIGAVVGVSPRWVIGISASTLFDRSFQTSFATTQVIGSDTVDAQESLRSEGAVNDVRLAVAYSLGRRARVGLGAHVVTGQNRFSLSRTFADSAPFGSISRSDRLDYTGQALSLGTEVRAGANLTFSASGRLGGALRVKTPGDTTRARASVPDRLGASVSYNGISGSNLVVRADWTQWSALEGIVTSGTVARDGWDLSAGGEVQGPRVASRVTTLRVGARRRALPFTALGDEVRETSFAGGLSVPLAGERAVFDASALRAARSAGNASETGWTIGFGLTIRQ